MKVEGLHRSTNNTTYELVHVVAESKFLQLVRTSNPFGMLSAQPVHPRVFLTLKVALEIPIGV